MNNIVVRALSRIFDFILLNLLWIVCSVPIVTIGASTTSLYSVMLKMVVNEECYILKDFFFAFKKNFKQSTIIWLILLVTGVILSVDFIIISSIPSGIGRFGLILLGIVIIFWFIEISFVFPLISTFTNTTRNMIKNAILIPASRLPYAVLVLILTGVCLMLTFLNEVTIMVGSVIWSLIGVAALTYVNAMLIRKLFEPYLFHG